MTQEIFVQGEHELTATMRALAKDLSDFSTPADQAAQLLLAKADPKTPRSSGRLAASGRVDAASSGPDAQSAVVYDEVYAGVIHNGWPAHNITPQPWLVETLDEQTSQAVDIYQDYLVDAVSRVRGA